MPYKIIVRYPGPSSEIDEIVRKAAGREPTRVADRPIPNPVRPESGPAYKNHAPHINEHVQEYCFDYHSHAVDAYQALRDVPGVGVQTHGWEYAPPPAPAEKIESVPLSMPDEPPAQEPQCDPDEQIDGDIIHAAGVGPDRSTHRIIPNPEKPAHFTGIGGDINPTSRTISPHVVQRILEFVVSSNEEAAPISQAVAKIPGVTVEEVE